MAFSVPISLPFSTSATIGTGSSGTALSSRALTASSPKNLGKIWLRVGTSSAMATGKQIAAGVRVTTKMTTRKTNWTMVNLTTVEKGTVLIQSALQARSRRFLSTKKRVKRSKNSLPEKDDTPMNRKRPQSTPMGMRPRVRRMGGIKVQPMKTDCSNPDTRCSTTYSTSSSPLSFTLITRRDSVWRGAWGIKPLVGGIPRIAQMAIMIPIHRKSRL
mmetsp:Transcript_150621/g.263254  ORF Transcript_150621/g.263254 Transcript_150621/m.263254 type:complete len:216 (-) Transcript_150621:971-1618(-)